MVAGLSLTSPDAMSVNEESTTHISALQFHHRSTNDIQNIVSDKVLSQGGMDVEAA